MLLLLTIPLLIVVLCVVVHFHDHFRFVLCQEKPSSLCRWCCSSKHEEYDFFPISFLLYMLLIIIISVLIICRYICNESLLFISLIHIDDLSLFSGNFPTPSFKQITSFPISSSLDWFIYSLMIITMLWESIFTFYRYYTTKILAQYLYKVQLPSVLKQFSVYAIIFIILFLLQTQIYYYIFPAVLLCYIISNLYWTLKTSRMIMNSVQTVTRQHVNKPNYLISEIEADLMHNVKVMRYLSVISTTFSSMYIAAFIVVYNMDIVYYFPFIWSLSITFFALNFIRNRRYITYILCRKNPSDEDNMAMDFSFVVCVDNIDKEKESEHGSHQQQQRQPVAMKAQTLSTPISLPVLHDTHNADAKAVGANKAHSTGNLLGLLHKNNGTKALAFINTSCTSERGTQTLSSTYLTPFPASFTTLTATPMSLLNDSADGFPSIQLKVIESQRATSPAKHPVVISKQVQGNASNNKKQRPRVGSCPRFESDSHPFRGNKQINTPQSANYCQRKNISTNSMQFLRKPTIKQSLGLSKGIKIDSIRCASNPLLSAKESEVSHTCDFSSETNPHPTPTSYNIETSDNNHLVLDNNINSSNTHSVPLSTIGGDRNIEKNKYPISHRHAQRRKIVDEREPSMSTSVLHLFMVQGFCDRININ